MPTLLKGFLTKLSKLLLKTYVSTFAIKAVVMFLGQLSESKIKIDTAVAQNQLCTSNQQVRFIMSKACEEAAILASKWPLLESLRYTAENTHSCLNVSCMVILEGLSVYLLPLLLTILVVCLSVSYIISRLSNSSNSGLKRIILNGRIPLPWKSSTTTSKSRIEEIPNEPTALVEK